MTSQTPNWQKRIAQWSYVLELIVSRHNGHNICDAIKRNKDKYFSGAMRQSSRLGVVDGIVLSVIGETQSTSKAKCMDKDVRGDGWPDGAIDAIPVKAQRHKVKSVRDWCLLAIERDSLRQDGERLVVYSHWYRR